MEDHWHCWQTPPATHNSIFVRYGFGGVYFIAVALLSLKSIELDPSILFFGAIILSSVLGGLGPGLLASAGSIIFVGIASAGHELLFNDLAELAHLACFAATCLISCLLVAGCRKEKELCRQNEERYRALIEAAKDGIVTVDQAGAILFMSCSCERIFGCVFRQWLGRSIFHLIPDAVCRKEFGEIIHASNSRETAPLLLHGRHQDGRELPLEVTFGVFSQPGKDGLTFFIRSLPSPVAEILPVLDAPATVQTTRAIQPPSRRAEQPLPGAPILDY